MRFNPSDIALYTRYILRDVGLRDFSLVDRLITTTKQMGDSFVYASLACHFTRLGPGQSADNRLRDIIQPSDSPLVIFERMLTHTVNNLDGGILARVRRDPSFDELMLGGSGWSQLGRLHRLIALACFDSMAASLGFNICGIPTSYLQDEDLNLDAYVRSARQSGRITPTVSYACRYWAYHASFIPWDGEVTSCAIRFLKVHALHWLEMVRLLRQDALSILQQLNESKVCPSVLHIRTLYSKTDKYITDSER